MEITKEYLQDEIARMEKQRNHAHEVAIACQAAIDTLQSLVKRLDAPASEESELGSSDPAQTQEAST